MPTYDPSDTTVIVVLPLPPPQCGAGETKCEGGVLYTCDSGLQWYNTGDPCPICTDGATQVQTCWDGSQVVKSICTSGQWVSTGNQCSAPPCLEGETKVETCSDGTEIITDICEGSAWQPTGAQCEGGGISPWVMLVAGGGVAALAVVGIFLATRRKK